MDLLETSSFRSIIALQTVLEELRNRSLPLYNRLRIMAKTEKKGIYIFHNDFRAETYIGRERGETINDRNDRGRPAKEGEGNSSYLRSHEMVQGTSH